MSAETMEWLADNTLIGFTEKRGNAWHYREGAENHFEGPVPPERVLELLSYPLAEAELTATVRGPRRHRDVYPVENRKAIVRTDTGAVFGIFSQDGYKIHQPREWCYERLNELLDGGLNVGSAVLLKGGAVAAVQAELDETMVGPEGIEHRPFLTAATSHDGSLATTYIAGSQVVVCDNTLQAALASAVLRKKVRHSTNSLVRIDEVRDDLGLIVAQIGDAIDQELKALTSRYVSDEQWQAFTRAYAGLDAAKPGRSETMAQGKIDTLNRLWIGDERVAPWKNSAYGVVAAVNTAVHHEFTVKGMERLERNQIRTLSGGWEKIDQDALALLAKV